MGEPAFLDYLTSIASRIQTNCESIESAELRVQALTQNGIDLPESQTSLNQFTTFLAATRVELVALQKLQGNLKQHWSQLNQRAIGHIVWAPPIGVGDAPYKFTRDLCVVELYKERFKHFIGNVLSLGAVLVLFTVSLNMLI